MISKEKKPEKSRIPEFASIEEEAEFWDTHSLADFWEEFRPIRVRFAKNLSQAITMRLDPVTLAKVRTMAKAKGMGPTTLMRLWILERLEKEEQLPSEARPGP